MIKKFFKGIFISIVFVFVLLAVLYCLMAYYYKDGFSYGTFINGIYCTGKTIDQVNTELLRNIGDYKGLTVVDIDGKSYTVSAEEVGLKYDFTDRLKELYYSQMPILWGENLIYSNRYNNFSPTITYNTALFEETVDHLPFFTHIPEDSRIVRINRTTNNGYELINMRLNVLNEEYAKTLITDSFNTFKDEVDLYKEGCYRNLSMTSEMEECIDLYNKIDEFQDRNIVYRFGEDTEIIDRSVASSFITTDGFGKFVLDENNDLIPDRSKMDEYVDSLAAKYDTYGTEREFRSTDSRIVKVSGGNYGNKIDTEAEKEYLYNAFINGINEEHEPVYEHEAPIKGRNDLGNTYIEIDLTKQRMYYYRNGIQEVATDIVTGCTANGHSTIRGTYYIYNHRQNTYLIGPDYRSYVRYWLGIFKGYGIHDASWRNKFGGEIYKTAGSHGCVNTPYENIKKMWEMVEDGTPVILFY
ncbi:MAG: L,D-transpeptidase/peptidoglycan binding protein [Lachnospiraceae bacterium]|nr:L,D-transpeptidase/peptidoglycan binding protein [Lachnospiraceae bacterium]